MPVLVAQSAAETLAELLRRRPAFVPEWRDRPEDAGDALQRIVARYAQIVGDRLNQAPDRAFLAFLDMLGISLIPARPARAPIVFKTFAGLGDNRAPAGTRVGANVAGVPSPVVFETENAIGLAGSRLTDVVAVWPDRDACANHSADAGGGRPFTLFDRLQPVPHVLYLAHDRIFDVARDASIEVAIELAIAGSRPMATAWEYWDGQVWQSFKASQDGTAGCSRSGTVSLQLTCGRPAKTTVAGTRALWIRARATEPLSPDPERVLAAVDRIRARSIVDQPATLEIETAFTGPLAVDVTSTFHPFGMTAMPGDVFYFANDEAFAKPGAIVSVNFTTASDEPKSYGTTKVRFEYWNGDRWTAVPGIADGAYFGDAGPSSYLTFTIPSDLATVEINGQTKSWLRARLISGGYFRENIVEVTGPPNQKVKIIEPAAPAIETVRIGYRWRPAFQPLEHCTSWNDFQYERHDRESRTPGSPFVPFRPIADATPAVYLGFDRALPNDLISLYIDVDENDAAAPPLIWEAWDGMQWRAVEADDGTVGLTRPGMVSLIAPAIAPRPSADVKQASTTRVETANALQAAPFLPGQLVIVAQGDKQESARVIAVEDAAIFLDAPLADTYNGGSVSLAPLARFGTPRDWIRARLKENGAPQPARVNGVFLNAAWVVQTQTITGEVLGSGNGQTGQTLFFSQFPVLPGEVIEVRELEGARAHVELPMLRDELIADGFSDADIRSVVDPRSGKVREVWVRWRARPHLFFSSPTDRHYVVERARGRIQFGVPGGRLPVAGADNIRAQVYRAGGGLAGNVPKGAIDQMLGGAFAEAVFNPRAASGGADGESPDGVRARGPETLRHRWRAMAAADFEAMAREASAGVAAVRVLPATAANGRPAPGWVTVVIVPQSREPRPQPSLELRQQVHDYLTARTPGTLDPQQVAVIGPTYLPIGVAALVVPRVRGDAGSVGDRVRAALERFLHPLAGGPEGRGWEFGRDVFLSDMAAILETVDGVDYVRQLDLLLDNAPVGAYVEVPPDRIVVAGPLRIEMEAEGR
jgi:predicted phage baseplate assembly protein